MHDSLILCTNIYECNMAARFNDALPLLIPLDRKSCSCGLCSSSATVLQSEARDLVASCPICSRIKGIKHDDIMMQQCLYGRGRYCIYCNCEYPIGDKDDSEEESKLIAEFLKIFIGQRLDSKLREDILQLLRYKKTPHANALGCEGFCELVTTVLNKMDDNEKKRRLKIKITMATEPLQILKKHCNGNCHEAAKS
jgi:hypothetical protein